MRILFFICGLTLILSNNTINAGPGKDPEKSDERPLLADSPSTSRPQTAHTINSPPESLSPVTTRSGRPPMMRATSSKTNVARTETGSSGRGRSPASSILERQSTGKGSIASRASSATRDMVNSHLVQERNFLRAMEGPANYFNPEWKETLRKIQDKSAFELASKKNYYEAFASMKLALDVFTNELQPFMNMIDMNELHEFVGMLGEIGKLKIRNINLKKALNEVNHRLVEFKIKCMIVHSETGELFGAIMRSVDNKKLIDLENRLQMIMNSEEADKVNPYLNERLVPLFHDKQVKVIGELIKELSQSLEHLKSKRMAIVNEYSKVRTELKEISEKVKPKNIERTKKDTEEARLIALKLESIAIRLTAVIIPLFDAKPFDENETGAEIENEKDDEKFPLDEAMKEYVPYFIDLRENLERMVDLLPKEIKKRVYETEYKMTGRIAAYLEFANKSNTITSPKSEIAPESVQSGPSSSKGKNVDEKSSGP